MGNFRCQTGGRQEKERERERELDKEKEAICAAHSRLNEMQFA